MSQCLGISRKHYNKISEHSKKFKKLKKHVNNEFGSHAQGSDTDNQKAVKLHQKNSIIMQV